LILSNKFLCVSIKFSNKTLNSPSHFSFDSFNSLSSSQDDFLLYFEDINPHKKYPAATKNKFFLDIIIILKI
jgi:hypothetical protein